MGVMAFRRQRTRRPTQSFPQKTRASKAVLGYGRPQSELSFGHRDLILSAASQPKRPVDVPLPLKYSTNKKFDHNSNCSLGCLNINKPWAMCTLLGKMSRQAQSIHILLSSSSEAGSGTISLLPACAHRARKCLRTIPCRPPEGAPFVG